MAQWKIEAGNEWVARDPFGAVKPTDKSHVSAPVSDALGVRLRAARNGYASFRLWVAGSGEYRLRAEAPGDGIEVDLFKAWYHKMGPKEAQQPPAPAYCVDALLPLPDGTPQRLPDPDNAIEGQTHQEYWVDVFVPADAAVGEVAGRIVLEGSDGKVELPLRLQVLEPVIPDEDAVICDHNSYGCRWVQSMYPSVFAGCADPQERWARTIEILQHYFRICREHRGMLSNLGHGHAGTVDAIYAPTLRGSGRDKTLEDWTLFDRHYGPLLDGSAFSTASPGAPRPRRPARSVWGVYTPINPDWPADYLHWGQPGYEVEFVRCVEQFDRHFREKGWVHTHPYLFFNHKKRYRWYEWDGDEPKYAKDDKYFLEMGRMWKRAIGQTPVPWLYRCDSSWQMKNHFTAFAGVVDFWVCGGFARWYPEEVRAVAERGDVIWTYSGTPAIDASSSAVLQNVFRMWGRGVSGHCQWLTTDPGPDPWFACDGAQTGMIYPGERFGIPGPIPSIRLKLERNGVQDINLIDARARAEGKLEQVRQALTEKLSITLWQRQPKIVREQPPEAWDSRNLSEEPDLSMAKFEDIEPLWWAEVRSAALEKATR